jgi:hypothetical protein
LNEFILMKCSTDFVPSLTEIDSEIENWIYWTLGLGFKVVLIIEYLSFIDPERGGFGVIFPEVMIFSEGLCPEENIITEENIAESPERRVYKWYIIPKVNKGPFTKDVRPNDGFSDPPLPPLSGIVRISDPPRTSAMPRKNSRNLVYVKSKKLFLLLELFYNYKCEYKNINY